MEWFKKQNKVNQAMAIVVGGGLFICLPLLCVCNVLILIPKTQVTPVAINEQPMTPPTETPVATIEPTETPVPTAEPTETPVPIQTPGIPFSSIRQTALTMENNDMMKYLKDLDIFIENQQATFLGFNQDKGDLILLQFTDDAGNHCLATNGFVSDKIEHWQSAQKGDRVVFSGDLSGGFTYNDTLCEDGKPILWLYISNLEVDPLP